MSEDSPAEEHEDARASEAKGGKQSVLEDDGDLSEASMARHPDRNSSFIMSDRSRKRKAHPVHESSPYHATQSPIKRRRSGPEATNQESEAEPAHSIADMEEDASISSEAIDSSFSPTITTITKTKIKTKKKSKNKEASTIQKDHVIGERVTTADKKGRSKRKAIHSMSKDRKTPHSNVSDHHASANNTTTQGEGAATSHGVAINSSPRKRSAEPYEENTFQEPVRNQSRFRNDAFAPASRYGSIDTFMSRDISDDDDVTPGQQSEIHLTPYSERNSTGTTYDQEACDDEIAPGTIRLLIKDDRKSFLQSPELTPTEETVEAISRMEIEEEQLAEEAKEKAWATVTGQSRFEKLPQEILNMIYRHVLYTDKKLQIASPELLTYEGLRLHLESLEREALLAETIPIEALEEMAKLRQNMSLYVDASKRNPNRKGPSISEFRLFDTSIFLVNWNISKDSQTIFYDERHLILDPGIPQWEWINGCLKISMSGITTARLDVTKHLTLRIPYTFIRETVDRLHDRENIKHLETIMCVPEEEDDFHWYNLDYWIEPLKLFRHIRAKFFRACPIQLTETVNLGMYLDANTLPLIQIYEGPFVSQRGMGRQRPRKFLQNLFDVVEGRPPRHKPEDVYPENEKGQREGTDYLGVAMPGFRKIPRIGPWT
ncbi:hypothetical protein BLS_001597 [Venturia inaequalis]|uniref:Uncharacterized protein n=1 Tax=Venturia inaequalis TaxID=5025 RepID=A0A8H3YIG3_VENIN|nr:hypothetical protein BLS_001597 [Venturia inaequalis]